MPSIEVQQSSSIIFRPQYFNSLHFSESMDSQGPWVIDSGASNHISDNDSVLTSVSSKISSSDHPSKWHQSHL